LEKKSSIWIKYSVKVPAEFVEPVVRMFTKFLTSNVYVEQIGDPEDKSKELNTLVSGFSKKNDESENLKFNLISGLSLFSGVFKISDISSEEINSDIWEKQKFEPIEIENIQILPSKEYKIKNGFIGIVIEPSMAFGTGHHPTTKMCITLIKEVMKEEFRVLDLGCGSGILGITALKFGAKNCLSIDIEDESIKATIKNSVDSKVLGIESQKQDLINSFDINFKPDLIIANLNSYLFKGGIKNIIKCMKSDTKLIASGILIENYQELKNIFIENNLLEIKKIESGDWTAILLGNNA
jgi:ribosomal protein L11 methyltransferase